MCLPDEWRIAVGKIWGLQVHVYVAVTRLLLTRYVMLTWNKINITLYTTYKTRDMTHLHTRVIQTSKKIELKVSA